MQIQLRVSDRVRAYTASRYGRSNTRWQTVHWDFFISVWMTRCRFNCSLLTNRFWQCWNKHKFHYIPNSRKLKVINVCLHRIRILSRPRVSSCAWSNCWNSGRTFGKFRIDMAARWRMKIPIINDQFVLNNEIRCVRWCLTRSPVCVSMCFCKQIMLLSLMNNSWTDEW